MPSQTECKNTGNTNPLYNWCMEVFNNDHGTCGNLCEETGDHFQLLTFITERINNLDDTTTEGIQELEKLNNEINFYRRTNQNLKKFIEEKNDLSNQRNLQILERKDKDTYELIIYYSILLIIAISFGIFCIYNYFNLPTK